MKRKGSDQDINAESKKAKAAPGGTKTDSAKESKVCPKCSRTYTSETSHRRLCGKTTVSCKFPAIPPADGVEVVTIVREPSGYFRCSRCQAFAKKKPQDIQKHAKTCTQVHPDGDRLTSATDDTNASHDRSPSLGSNPVENCLEDEAFAPQPNIFEALVRPSSDSVLDDPLLKTTPFIVNTSFHILICTHCQRAVNPNKAVAHIAKNHKACTLPIRFSEQLLDKYPDLINKGVDILQPIEAIFGLAIPADEFIVCSRCHHGYNNVKGWQTHACKESGIELGDQPKYFTSLVQTFFYGPKRRYFAIRTPQPTSAQPVDAFSIFQSQTVSLEEPNEKVSVAEDYRQQNQFLVKEGWIEHVNGLSASDLCSISTPPAKDAYSRLLYSTTYEFMVGIQDQIFNAGFHVRRLLGRRPSDSSDSFRTIHHRDVRPQTLKRYAALASSLIYFVSRCHERRECGYTMSLTPDQERACRELDKAIGGSISCVQAQKNPSEGGSQTAVDDDGDDRLFSDWNTTIAEDGDDVFLDDIKDPDDEVFDDLSGTAAVDDLDEDDPGDAFICSQVDATDEENPGGSEFQALERASARGLQGVEYASDLHEKILEALIPLYCHLPGPNDTKFYSPILRFIILKSLKPNGEWLPSRRITQLIAALLFTGRLVVMALMRRGLGVGGRYSQAFSAIANYLKEENEGPMPTLYLLLRPLNRLVSAEQGTLEFNATDFTGTNIILDRKVLRLTDFGNFVGSLICESEAIIRDQLFFGLDICDVAWSPGIVHEEPRNTSPGYSCFRDARNEFVEQEHTLIRAVLTHPKLRGRFHFLDGDGRIVWKAGACLEYVAVCHKVEMLLFAAGQTSAGEPGRGTEIASHLITNISGGSIRNVFIMFQYLCWMGTFNKSSHLSDRDLTMIRVPHPDVGRLWVILIVFVRPWIVILQRFFRGEKAAARARDRLFFGPERAVTSGDLSRTLSFHTHRLLGVKIPLSLLRHIVTWFLNCHSVRLADQLALSNRAALSAQMGHSENTHALYAGDSRLPRGVDYHMFFLTMRASGEWHRLLGLEGSRLLEEMDAGRVSATSDPLPVQRCNPAPAAVSAKDVATEVVRQLLPQLAEINSQTRANDLAIFLEAAGLKMPTPISAPATPAMPCHVHPSRLRDLRNFLHDEQATFDDVHQALAVELIATRRPAVFLLGPTRASRMLPILMDAVVYRRDGLNVLVLPFAEMFANYLHQAQVHGIQCKTWPLDDLDQEVPQLLLAAAGHFTSPDIHQFLVTSFSLSRLERVTLEEAHLMPSMAAVQQLVETLRRLPVPIFVTSSACPMGMERSLLDSFGRKAYDALRGKANDLKISFQAYAVASSQMLQEARARISAKMLHLKGTGCALLYCQTSEECDRMAGELGWLPLHASVPVSHRDDAITRWKNGDTPGLVCDTALGYCLNSSSVRYVFHFGAPRNVIDYIASISELHQSRSAHVIIFFDPSCLAILRDSEHLEAVAVHDMLVDPTLCMRIIPGIVLHGNGIPCAMLPGAELCTACEAQLSAPLPLDGPRRFPLDLAQKYGHISSVAEGTHPRTGAFSAWAAPDLPPLSPTVPAGYQVLTICRAMESACVPCWLNEGLAKGKSHRFGECLESRSIAQSSSWKEWVKRLRLPADSCYFCGISLTMECDAQIKGSPKVHSHSADCECPWAFILKPLAYLVQHDAAFWKGTTKLSPPKDQALYQRWLISVSDDGMPIMVALLLLAYESRPPRSTVV